MAATRQSTAGDTSVQATALVNARLRPGSAPRPRGEPARLRAPAASPRCPAAAAPDTQPQLPGPSSTAPLRRPRLATAVLRRVVAPPGVDAAGALGPVRSIRSRPAASGWPGWTGSDTRRLVRVAGTAQPPIRRARALPP